MGFPCVSPSLCLWRDRTLIQESQMVYLVASMMCIGAISGLSSQQTVLDLVWSEWTRKLPIFCLLNAGTFRSVLPGSQ